MATTPNPQEDADAADAANSASQDKNTKSPAKKRSGMKRGESKHSPRRIESVERQAMALEYRKMGLSYAQIADKLEMASAQAAWYCVEAALKRTLQDGADDVRKIELERLDAMFIPVYGNACRGDLMALNSALAIMTRRARLLGLDAPVKQEYSGKDGKDLVMTPTVIVIGGPGEEGEPEVMGASVVPPDPAPT